MCVLPHADTPLPGGSGNPRAVATAKRIALLQQGAKFRLWALKPVINMLVARSAVRGRAAGGRGGAVLGDRTV